MRLVPLGADHAANASHRAGGCRKRDDPSWRASGLYSAAAGTVCPG